MTANTVSPRLSPFGRHKAIDVDSHLSEPHDLWTSRAPASIRDQVPQVKTINGRKAWVIAGDQFLSGNASPISVVLPDGRKARGREFQAMQIEDVHPSSWRLADRLAFMDSQGISAQIMYPNVLGFGGQKSDILPFDIRLAAIEIFNDAMAEYQEESGQRIFPMALMPWWDPHLSAKEAERCAKMGLRGVNINTDPQSTLGLSGENLPDLASPFWDPMWDAFSAFSLPVNFHIGATSDIDADWFGNNAWASIDDTLRAVVNSSVLYLQNARVIGNVIAAGIIDRFPNLRFVSVESGIGWIPGFLEALDYQYDETAIGRMLPRKPSEYFQTNFHACFWFERKDVSNVIRTVGVDNVMFETDFPHPTCLLPIDNMMDALQGLTFEEQAKVLYKNAENVYNIKA